MKNKPLITVLITVLMDIISLGFIIPSLPFIVKNFWYSESWVWIAFWIFSLWMLVWWLVLWRFSDIYWRKNILVISTTMNMLWYLVLAFSPNIYVFMIWRFLSWIWSSGWAVWQAYISDVSSDSDRTKNLWLIWAMFWIWFILWPVFWSIVNTQNLIYLWLIPAGFVLLNILLIIFVLKDIRKVNNKSEEESAIPLDFHHNKKQIYILFLVSFITATWFAWLQSTFALLMNDRFGYWQDLVWYFFAYIWFVSLTYQALIIKYTRKYLDEKGMILLGLGSLIFSFALFWANPYALAILPIITFHPLGMWNINPATASSLAKLAEDEVWKALWTNNSFMSLWNIVWAILAWYLYEINSWFPYYFASSLFLILWIVVMYQLKIRKKQNINY